MDSNLSELNLNENQTKMKKDINMLLLGEMGVDKSTFINAFVNYINFKTFAAAKEGQLNVLIPAKIHIVNKDSKSVILDIGQNDNKIQKENVSALQHVQSYVFPLQKGNVRLRFIITPGFADNRGVVQDTETCEHILDYIGQLPELHVICFVMNPSNTRLTSWFVFCVKELFSRLEKNVSKNTVFIFSNNKVLNFSLGDTLLCLKTLISIVKEQSPNIQIPLDYDNNVFCFPSNDAFRGLVAIKHNVELAKSFVNYCSESWDISVKEAQRLVRYIIGDGSSKSPLTPLYLKNSFCVNEARRVINQLSQPLADVAQLIYDNIRALDKHQEKLEGANLNLDDLKANLYIPIINLDVTNLPYPATVCTSKKCTEIYKVGKRNKYIVKDPCHGHCYLQSFTKELIGDSALVDCEVMKGNKLCEKCGCDFSLHMHVYYTTKTIEDKIEEDSVKTAIRLKEHGVRKAEVIVNEIKQKKIELEQEKNVVVRSMAQFAHFLQNNTITPFKDPYKKYLDCLIKRENSLGNVADTETINDLKSLKKQYEELKKAFDSSLKCKDILGDDAVVAEVTSKTIIESVPKLYKLHYNGQKIKQLCISQKTPRNYEYKKMEYIYDPSINVPTNEIKSDGQNKNIQQNIQNKTSQQSNKTKTEKKQQLNELKPFNNEEEETAQLKQEMNRNMPPPYMQTPMPYHFLPFNNPSCPVGGQNYPPPSYYSSAHIQHPYYPYPHPSSYGSQPPKMYGNQQFGKDTSNISVKVEVNQGDGASGSSNPSNYVPVNASYVTDNQSVSNFPLEGDSRFSGNIQQFQRDDLKKLTTDLGVDNKPLFHCQQKNKNDNAKKKLIGSESNNQTKKGPAGKDQKSKKQKNKTESANSKTTPSKPKTSSNLNENKNKSE